MCHPKEAASACYWKDVWKKLYLMRQSSSLCDVTLRSDDGTNICAHSIILASGSSVFHAHLLERKATFLEQTHLSTILLRGVTADVLQVTLDFIYGITPETIADFKKLRIGAEKLGIDGAKAFCVQQIRELEAVGNVDDVASTSTSSSSPHSSATTSTRLHAVSACLVQKASAIQMAST